jgi:hypothetical protein
MRSMQCNMEFRYQLSICSGTKKNHGKPWLSRQPLFEVRNYFTTDVQSVSQSVCSGVEHPLGLATRYYFCQYVVVWKSRSCFCGAPSLTRRRVWNLQCNHSMVRVAQNTYPYFIVMWDSPNQEGQVPVFISPRNRQPLSYNNSDINT